jgi:hypothetical protein
VVPGSHRLPVESRFVRKPDGTASMQPPGVTEFDTSKAKSVPAKKGSPSFRQRQNILRSLMG